MKLLIFFIISIVQVSHAIYPTGCKKKGYSCFNDENMDDKYYECTEVYEGIRTCPRGTKCVQKERDEEVIPCETVKAKPFSLLKQKIWSKRSSHLKTEQLPPDFNVTECTISGLFCIMDGEHDYQYYECSDTYQGYRDCAQATICAGEEGNPYDYNPCVNDPNATIVSSSGTTSETSSGTTSSGTPSTPSVGSTSSSGSLPPDYNVTECKVNGLFCVMDGNHDYQYYECSDTYQGYRDCAVGTKCAGDEGNPYDYNPCVNDPNATIPTQSSETSSGTTSSESSSGIPSTPSVGTSSSGSLPPDYNVTECTISGLFCIMDGEHDYQYYECSDTYQGFRDCAEATKCAGEEGNPYDYNPCINDPNATIPTQSSSGTTSSESSSGTPTTPSVGSTSSSGSLPPDYNVTECKVNGLFCIMDGEHDYQYYECSDTYQGYRDCAQATKCAGEEGNPYDYNPCVNDPNATIPTQSSSGTTSSESSSGTPSTPSVGTSSSGGLPPDYNITECKVNGLFCIMDGEHDYQYYECSDTYQGYRDCAVGTKCAGEEGNPYDYNPCVNDPNAPVVSSGTTSSESSSGTPTTPSVGSTSSSGGLPPDYNVTECKIEGLFCVMDGEHDYQYYECSDTYQGYRDCAQATKCAGEEGNPYDYNPCVNDPNAPAVSSSGTTSETSSGAPSTPSVGSTSSSGGLPPDYNVTECTISGLFCIMDGEHDYQYYECSDTYQGFRDCAQGTKCAGEQNNPYDYNPCINDPNAPIPTQSSETSSETSSGTPTTPSVGSTSSSTSSESSSGTSSSSFSSSGGLPPDYNVTECKVNGLFCIIDGEHDYQYYECSDTFKGFRDCATGTKCAGEQNNPYDYNPCINDPNAPVVSSSGTTSSESSSEKQSSQTSESSSGTPSTPSVGASSSSFSSSSSGLPPDYNVTECKVNGLFCVMDGNHDYQYYECSDTFKGFRDCAPGTKCAGEQDAPYDYNPCINDPNAPVASSETQSSSEKQSSSEPTTSESSFSDNSTETTSSSSVSSDSNSTTSESSSGTPTTPSVGSTSSSGLPPDYNVTECKIDGLFCIIDGDHDYQYYECSDTYQGFRDCAPGTKCAGEQNNPYDYNPCVNDPNAPVVSSSEKQSSSEPIISSDSNTTSSETPSESSDSNSTTSSSVVSSDSNSTSSETSSESSSGTPSTPSVGTSSSSSFSSSSSGLPPDYNVTECKVNGLFCVMDGNHDYQYYECSDRFKGFRDCAPGTKCAGEQDAPYKYNPCIIDPNAPIPIQSSSEPTTPSVGTSSSGSLPPDYNVTECKIEGLFCVMDGKHDYQYYECSDSYGGFRNCAPGTKCGGEEGNPYNYNPCVNDPNAPIPTQSSSEKNPSETTESSSEKPVTPSVGTSSSSSGSLPPDYNVTECKIEGLFCIMDGNHDYQYYECSETYKGYRSCAPGTKCAGKEGNPYDYNPCVVISETDSSTSEKPATSSGTPVTPSVGVSSEEDDGTCGSFVCPSFGIFCYIDGKHNNKYCECSQTFNGSRPCAPGTWCRGPQDTPYEYNPCVFIDQTTWFGNETKTL